MKMCEKRPNPYFPLFVNLSGKRATIIGGGDTACVKAKMLLRFGAKIRVISPEISPEMSKLVSGGSVSWLKSAFSPELLEGTDLLVAATNVRSTNHEAYEAAREQRILVNVCDSRAESSFLFPSVVQNDTLVAGIVTTENASLSAIKLMRKIREKISSL